MMQIQKRKNDGGEKNVFVKKNNSRESQEQQRSLVKQSLLCAVHKELTQIQKLKHPEILIISAMYKNEETRTSSILAAEERSKGRQKRKMVNKWLDIGTQITLNFPNLSKDLFKCFLQGFISRRKFTKRHFAL